MLTIVVVGYAGGLMILSVCFVTGVNASSDMICCPISDVVEEYV